MSRITPQNASLSELKAGYSLRDLHFDCLHCNESRRQGHIYPVGDDLLDAEEAIRRHVQSAHGSPFEALLALGKKGTGLSDTQRSLLGWFHAGLGDREIQPLAGDISLSTVRNHRFTLREKARQARAFVAMMELIESGAADAGSSFIEIPGSKRADDERFAITRAEFAKIVHAHFPDGPDGRLDRMPKKEKHKIIVMIQVLKRLAAGRRYTNREMDEILSEASDDHVTLRRYLVDYGFLDRTPDGREYWLD